MLDENKRKPLENEIKQAEYAGIFEHVVVFLLCYFIVAFFASKVCVCVCERARRESFSKQVKPFYLLFKTNTIYCIRWQRYIYTFNKNCRRSYSLRRSRNLMEGAKFNRKKRNAHGRAFSKV